MISLTESIDGSCSFATKIYKHSSLQINLNKIANKKIIEWGKQQIPDNCIYEEKNNPIYGREYEIHVTISCTIKDDEIETIKKELNNQKSFYIEFGEVYVLENENFDVLAISVESPELRRIKKNICGKLRKFKPHATIAFLKKKSKIIERVPKKDFLSNRILIDTLTLSYCDGSKSIIELK